MLDRLRLLQLKSVGLQCGLMAVALCMVLVQSVVGMHRVLHFQNVNAPLTATQLSDNASVAVEADKGLASSDGHKGGVWGDHTRVSDCQLFDQVCADASPVAMWFAPPVVQLPGFMAQSVLATWVECNLFFSARGPPVVC
jgi:hypothetical protein